MKTQQTFRARKAPLAAAVAMLLSGTAFAGSYQKGDLAINWDSTLSYGASWRVAERDDDLVGKANLNPAVYFMSPQQQLAAPGRLSVNTDEGNLNYDKGDLISHAVKFNTEMEFSYRNFGGFFRASAFYDFENADNDRLTDIAQEFVGTDVTMLDAYLYANFDLGENHPATMRVGRQVVSWGESAFIQGGINVINAVDVSKLRVAGAELKDALMPMDMIYGSVDLTENLSMEGVYMLEFEQIDPDPMGTYFSSNDFATPGAEFVMLGWGLVGEQTPGATVYRSEDRYPDADGQFGLSLRYFSPELNDTEFGLYYLNYHSRLPLISAVSVSNPDVASATYFVEYPEDIELFGASFNTLIEPLGVAWAGEISFRPEVPLQFDDVELLFAALSPLNQVIPQAENRFYSQLGNYGWGEEVGGWDFYKLTQAQFTLTKVFGPGNIFQADQIALLGEFGATIVSDMPNQDILRFNGPGTDTGGGPDASVGVNRNPITEPDGFADDFSWGYRLFTRLNYNAVFGSPVNLAWRLGFGHDVKGTSPGPGGQFIEDRKSFTTGLTADYLSKWSADLSYTNFFDGGRYNLIADRDFASFNIKYSF